MSSERSALVLVSAVVGMAAGALLAEVGIAIPFGWAILAAVGALAAWRLSREDSAATALRRVALVLMALVLAQLIALIA